MSAYNETLASLKMIGFIVSAVSTIVSAHYARQGIEKDQDGA